MTRKVILSAKEPGYKEELSSIARSIAYAPTFEISCEPVKSIVVPRILIHVAVKGSSVPGKRSSPVCAPESPAFSSVNAGKSN